MSSAGWLVENLAIDVDGEPLGLGGLDRGYRLFEAAFHADPIRRDVPRCRRDAPREQIRRMARRDQLLSSNSALAHSDTNSARTMPSTISPISLWISGSPPGIATIGALHRRPRRGIRHRKPLVEDRVGINRFCRSRSKRDCIGTAVPASAPVDNACGRQGADAHIGADGAVRRDTLTVPVGSDCPCSRKLAVKRDLAKILTFVFCPAALMPSVNRGKREFDGLLQNRSIRRREPGRAAQRVDHVRTTSFRRRGAGGDADVFGALEPILRNRRRWCR